MVTYKHVTKVVRNRCVNHKAKRGDSRAILLLIATPVGALIIQIIKAPTKVAIRRSIALESILFA